MSFFKNNYYLRRIWLFLLIYFGLEAVEVSVVALRDGSHLNWGLLPLLEMAGTTLIETGISFLYWMIPFLLYLWLLPRKKHLGRADRIVTLCFFALFVGANAFEEVAELLFWDEFASSFNFIAVDYLIYTKEVVGNITQSYPIVLIVSCIVVFALLMTWLLRKALFPALPVPSARFRALAPAGVVVLCVAAYFCVDIEDAEKSGNRYNDELSKDGFYSLFSAFLKNELEYDKFYITCDKKEAAGFLRKELKQENMTFSDQGDALTRTVTPAEPELKANVIVVIMESMGSEFLNENGKYEHLTDNLTRLGSEGLFFPKTYATGTRSVRGLEAVSTSLPPLPGMSILRRKGNENIQTIGSLFSGKGYETKWIYGGYGLFDNMNYFYENNGFQVVDRTDLKPEEITHTTVWGVCDEDLFHRVVKESDRSFASGKPFLNVVFTTSNHRPYTYPEGKIDIPSKTGRSGAVKYADYAVGEFVREAQTRPWFDNTVFLFIADHGAGSAGKKELNPETHLIPLIIYAPKLIKPRRFDYPISQIDALPTLLGVLNMPYTANFYGQDARLPDYKSRYFLCNYQNIGYGEGDSLVVLKPARQVTWYEKEEKAEATPRLKTLEDKAVRYFEHASDWRRHLANPQAK